MTSPKDTAPKPVPDPDAPVESPTQKRARRQRERRAAAKEAENNARVMVEGEPTAQTGPGRPTGSGTKLSKRAQNATNIIALVGVSVYAFEQYDGQVILDGAENLGVALADVAAQNPTIARALDGLTETSAWAQVAIAVSAIALPIVKHHVYGKPAPIPAGPVPQPRPTVVAADAEVSGLDLDLGPDSPIVVAPDGAMTFQAVHTG